MTSKIAHIRNLYDTRQTILMRLVLMFATALLFGGCLPPSLLDSCQAFRTIEERRACETGRVRAETENTRERVYRAERYGYEIYRQRRGF